MIPPLDWMADAACVEHDPELFHNRAGFAKAREVCAECPVLMECRAHAMRHVESGIWGGMTERQRYGRRAIHLAMEVDR